MSAVSAVCPTGKCLDCGVELRLPNAHARQAWQERGGRCVVCHVERQEAAATKPEPVPPAPAVATAVEPHRGCSYPGCTARPRWHNTGGECSYHKRCHAPRPEDRGKDASRPEQAAAEPEAGAVAEEPAAPPPPIAPPEPDLEAALTAWLVARWPRLTIEDKLRVAAEAGR